MKKFVALLFLFQLSMVQPAQFAQVQSSEKATRFGADDAVVLPSTKREGFFAVDLFIDPQGTPLASYQLELDAGAGAAVIVGVEEGDYPIYTKAQTDGLATVDTGPLWHDPQALQHNRLILADFVTDSTVRLPNQAVRIATIHLMDGDVKELKLTLQAAGSPGGHAIPATTYLRAR